ncbi:hypothetical protein [Cohnella terricola]|uniref:Uncharacterized protein n=1 Tax=Cohnella terricola TaxID=1289167 RepID=A0A559J5C7_9BACL|nr:hypothetical protein [Cohnella terricola]TVX95094.1 hypothetical protein FPZ45_24120 [Cohnella terricola]
MLHDELTIAKNKIRNAVIAGVFCSVTTLLMKTFGSGYLEYEYDWIFYFDLAIPVGLTLGVYRKSRVCAILLFVCYLYSKIIYLISAGPMSGSDTMSLVPIMMSMGYLYMFGQGISGAFAYHKLKKRNSLQLNRTEISELD